MSTPQNLAAWLKEVNTPLEVGLAPLPSPGKGEIVVKNAAVAINPLDWHMQDQGVFVQQWPTVFGCDVAGEVFEVGPGADRFKKGDRVIGHAINLVTGRPCDGAYQLYTVVPADKAAILPHHISYTDGVVMPFALEAAVCALCVTQPGLAMPGVSTPALGLPYPTLGTTPPIDKTVVVYGASSSVGAMTTQVAVSAGIEVIAIAGAHNHEFATKLGATAVFDHKDPQVVQKVIEAVKVTGNKMAGVVDAISNPQSYARNMEILQAFNGGHLACSHPPPTEGVPSNVTTGMIFAMNDIATPIFRDFVTPALQSGQLKPLPAPTVVGKGLEYINEALKRSKAGVSATKLVVEL